MGIEDFAEAITTLAMQKPSSRPGEGILLWHVFQLQCIVDSTTVSRGWSFGWSFGENGHELKQPPQEYCPRRDVDAFLGYTTEFTPGFAWGIGDFIRCLEGDAIGYGNPARHQSERDMLKGLATHVQQWLGNCKNLFDSTGMSSRFSKNNSNGLWDYSPFLCGVGLAEALELTYRLSMIAWDRTYEPIALVHLHNLLLKEGLMKKEDAPALDLIADTLSTAFFPQGQAPVTEFHQAYITLIKGPRTTVRREASRRVEIKRFFKAAEDSHDLLSMNFNLYFRQKTNLMLYREAGWNLERIPESETLPHTVLGMIRIAQTKRIVDPATGYKTFEKTDLVMRAKAQGSTDESIVRNFRTLGIIQTEDADELPKVEHLNFLESPFPEGRSASAKRFGDASGDGYAPSGLELLTMMWHDVCLDISGCRPASGLNYPQISADILLCFAEWERQLEKAQNPLYLDVYVKTLAPKEDRRVVLTQRILLKRRGYKQCLELLVKAIIGMVPDLRLHYYSGTSTILKGQRCCPYEGGQDAVSPFLMSIFELKRSINHETKQREGIDMETEGKAEDNPAKENAGNENKKVE